MPDFKWLERELYRQLAPVKAPESLWHRINSARPLPEDRVSFRWMLWPVAAAMVALVSASIAGNLHNPGMHKNVAPIREQELLTLARNSTGGNLAREGYNFQSDSMQATRAWLKSAANIDIDLPSVQPAPDSGAVQLMGVRLIHLRGLPVAAVRYRVGDEIATLFVSRRQGGPGGNSEAPKHLFSQVKTAGDERLFSWNMGNQTYTIAFTGARDSHGACLLCHASTRG